MSGVWPWRAGGTMPPLATTRFPGQTAASASRSIAWARARRNSTLEVTEWLWSKCRYADQVAGPIRAVHHAHEVGSRCHQAELDRSLVEGPHADPIGVAILPQVVVLAVLEHEVDGHGGAGAVRVEDALDPELHVPSCEGLAVRPA